MAGRKSQALEKKTRAGKTATTTFARVQEPKKAKAPPRDTISPVDELLAEELRTRDSYMEPVPDNTAADDLVRFDASEVDSDEDNEDAESVASSEVSYYAKKSASSDHWSSDDEESYTPVKVTLARVERKPRSIIRTAPASASVVYGRLAEETYIDES